jgi:hypothetical protein
MPKVTVAVGFGDDQITVPRHNAVCLGVASSLQALGQEVASQIEAITVRPDQNACRLMIVMRDPFNSAGLGGKFQREFYVGMGELTPGYLERRICEEVIGMLTAQQKSYLSLSQDLGRLAEQAKKAKHS